MRSSAARSRPATVLVLTRLYVHARAYGVRVYTLLLSGAKCNRIRGGGTTCKRVVKPYKISNRKFERDVFIFQTFQTFFCVRFFLSCFLFFFFRVRFFVRTAVRRGRIVSSRRSSEGFPAADARDIRKSIKNEFDHT